MLHLKVRCELMLIVFASFVSVVLEDYIHIYLLFLLFC